MIKPLKKILSPEWFGIPLLFPALIIVFLVIFYPLAQGFYLSFNNLPGGFGSSPIFVGLYNFETLFFRDEVFWISLLVSFVYMIVGPIEVFISLGLALILRERFVGKDIFRIILVLPIVLPSIAVYTVWNWILQPYWGIVDYYSLALGLTSEHILWFENKMLALPFLMFIVFWGDYSMLTLLLYARLNSIPDDLYDAAKIDGAGVWGRFRHVTLSESRELLLTLLLFRNLMTFNTFDPPFLLTEGGPAWTTTNLILLTYYKAFKYWQVGLACAVGVVILIITSGITLFQIKLYRVGEEAE